MGEARAYAPSPPSRICGCVYPRPVGPEIYANDERDGTLGLWPPDFGCGQFPGEFAGEGRIGHVKFAPEADDVGDQVGEFGLIGGAQHGCPEPLQAVAGAVPATTVRMVRHFGLVQEQFHADCG